MQKQAEIDWGNIGTNIVSAFKANPKLWGLVAAPVVGAVGERLVRGRGGFGGGILGLAAALGYLGYKGDLSDLYKRISTKADRSPMSLPSYGPGNSMASTPVRVGTAPKDTMEFDSSQYSYPTEGTNTAVSVNRSNTPPGSITQEKIEDYKRREAEDEAAYAPKLTDTPMAGLLDRRTFTGSGPVDTFAEH